MTDSRKKYEIQEKTILRKNKEIDNLRDKILSLKCDVEKKDEIINSLESLRIELNTIINDLHYSKNKYEELLIELEKMRNMVDKVCFKGRWKLIKFLMNFMK